MEAGMGLDEGGLSFEPGTLPSQGGVEIVQTGDARVDQRDIGQSP